jgi:hypothetical protein
MKAHHVRFGQTILTPVGPAKIVALVIGPWETVLLSGDGFAPGTRLDPAQWQAAVWDARGQCWVVPAAPERPRSV